MFAQWLSWSKSIAGANIEAQRVIGLRLMKLAKGGPAAAIESQKMVTEKLAASAEAGISLASGKSPHAVLQRYRVIMRANARRLRAEK